VAWAPFQLDMLGTTSVNAITKSMEIKSKNNMSITKNTYLVSVGLKKESGYVQRFEFPLVGSTGARS
jgi:hypothetical protein